MRPPPAQVALARKYGAQYGVDPRLLLAIGGHETQWGTLGAGRQGYTLGYGATDTGLLSKYAGPENQYRYAAQTLAKWGVHSLPDILAGRAASYATDPGWERGVAGVYSSLGGLPGGPAGPPAGPPPARPLASPLPARPLASPLPAQTPGPGRAPRTLREIPTHVLEAVNKTLTSGAGLPAGGAALPTSEAPLPGSPGAGGLLSDLGPLPQFTPRAAPARRPSPSTPYMPAVQPVPQPTAPTPKTTTAATAGASIVQAARQQLGEPYVWGGESRREGGFDCSGLVDYAMRQQGYRGPRVTTYTLAKMGTSVKGGQLQPGDLIITHGGGHVVIYAGNNAVIAAPHRGTSVQYQGMPSEINDVRRLSMPRSA